MAVQKNADGVWKDFYAGIGIAMLTLIDSTVRATIRHNDNEPIASEAATASINRDDATGAVRPLKPTAPGDRVMAGNPSMRGRITRNALRYRRDRRQYCGGPTLENGQMTAVCEVMPAISAIQRGFGPNVYRPCQKSRQNKSLGQ
jgi:hypothetical protein